MSNTSHQIPEWRTFGEVINEPGLILTLNQEANENLDSPSFYLFVKRHKRAFRVSLDQKLWEHLLVERESHEFHSNDLVRLYDPNEGCTLPWPSKPYPDVKKFAKQKIAIQKAEELKRRAERDARTIENLEYKRDLLIRSIKKTQDLIRDKQNTVAKLKEQATNIQDQIDKARAALICQRSNDISVAEEV